MLKEQLSELISTMTLPLNRTTHLEWLYENLKERNLHHPNYQDAMIILKILLSNGKGSVQSD